MPTRTVQKIALSIAAATGSGTVNFTFDPVNLSNASALRFRLHLSTIGVDAGDTFNFYVQSRGPDGVWNDRCAFPQYLGTASDDEVYDMVVRALHSLGSDGEGYEPQGSTGGSRLTAGEVVNGPFPGNYSGDITGPQQAPGPGWRLQCVLVDADNDAFMTGTLYVDAVEDF